jgi:adenylate kinase family enzyme
MKPKKIFILGTVGSGKSTLAKELSKKLKIKHYDLDDVFWTKKFNQKRTEKERDKLLLKICKKKSWIIEGVYTDWIEKGIKKSDLVVLLKIPFRVLLYRITKRTLKREKSKLKGKERYNENFKDYLNLLRAAKRYPKKSYLQHKELVDKHKVNFIVIQKNKEIKNFIKEIEIK